MIATIEPEPERYDQEETKPEATRPGMPFFPDFALREAVSAFLLLVVLLLLASLTKPTLEEVANPSASGYVPRPEWYFLWFFQLLKYFKGPFEVLGTFVVPLLAIGLLIAVPFLDRRRAKGRPLLPGTRPVRLWPRAAGAGLVLTILYLTLIGVSSSAPMPQQGPELTPVQAAGKALFDKMGCASCHSIGGVGGSRGPNLTTFGSRPDAQERVLLHFSGIGTSPESIMPGYQLSPEELRSLSAYLLSLKQR